jgi:hypothetical protein
MKEDTIKFNFCPGCGENLKIIYLTINELSFCKNCYYVHLKPFIGDIGKKSEIKKLKNHLEINFEFGFCPGCGKKMINNPYTIMKTSVDPSDGFDDLIDNSTLCKNCGLEYIRNGNESIDFFMNLEETNE